MTPLTQGDIIRYALEGTASERQLAIELIQALSEVNALKKQVTAPSMPSVTITTPPSFSAPDSQPVCVCGKPWWGTVPPVCPAHAWLRPWKVTCGSGTGSVVASDQLTLS